MKFLFFLFVAIFFIWACKPIKHTQNQPLVGNKTDTIPTRFEPDPFSALLELETDSGTMKLELFFHTPIHRENMVKLAKQGFYNGLLFHRVIKGFMAQGGDPTSRNARKGAVLGGGGTGNELDNEINSTYFHLKGALCAARTSDNVNPDKKSSGCQFYIVHGRPVTDDQLDRNERKYNVIYSPEQRRLYKLMGGAAQLDMEYTVFGRVYEGLDVLEKLMNVATDNNDRPNDDLKMKIKVIRE